MKEYCIRRYRSDTGAADSQGTLIRIDDSGRIVHADHHCEPVLGYHASELEGRPIMHLVAAQQDDLFAPTQRLRFAKDQPVLITLRHKDGFFFGAHVTLHFQVRDTDKPASAHIALRDPAQPDPHSQPLIELTGNLGSWELAIHNNRVTWSAGMYRLLDLRAGSDITAEQALSYCAGKQERVRALFRRCLRTGRPFSIDLKLLTARQRTRHVRLTGQALKSGKRVTRLAGTAVDRTRVVQLDQRRRATDQLLKTVLAANQDLVAALDPQLNLTHMNAAWEQQFSTTFKLTPRVGDNLGTLLSSFASEQGLQTRLWQQAMERVVFQAEMPLARRSRLLQGHETRLTTLQDLEGNTIGALLIARDARSHSPGAGQGGPHSAQDPVTGLPTRSQFLAHFDGLLNPPAPSTPQGGLLFIGLDNFTPLNIAAGNAAGDRYLRELAAIMAAHTNRTDLLTRLAGDTFALWLDNHSDMEARRTAQHLLEAIAAFAFDWQGKLLQTTASAGLVFVDGNASRAPEQLLSEAAELCHTAKSAGRNRVHADRASQRLPSERDHRQQLAHLQHCLDHDGLILHYQMLRPVASATWGDHIEILARLADNDADNPSVQPEAFLPIANQFSLGKQLDQQIIRKALAVLDEQPLLVHRLKYCGFNLSQASVLDEGFADWVQALLAPSPFAPDIFCFEVNESVAARYPDEVAILCDSLHAVGCKVALDGAGASVESYHLAGTLPVDIVKLDHSMMQQLPGNPVQQVMVEALHKISTAAGKLTVATFIEDEDTLRQARRLGIHFGQGFHLGSPAPLASLIPQTVTSRLQTESEG
ncbi:EAL domain-containing protein [Marinobacter sp. X15-166B]|uniref:EAL domain-containing protein n=1 Tax=Marinobacter sp. X15-166B TaxID=1897620 RepID=UPI00085C2F8A|nr:EAL domain-containing protein [Marinobacter sp. X15-166B]OEY66452.1 hypothetical protein BG841_08265 [Marinobacter sp. X15-166B]